MVKIVEGDLLEQPVEVIVNAWNRNFIPWWLLVPQGVSGAIKRRAGYQPFVELGRYGTLSLGQAVLTSAGKLPYQGIIHVAGIGNAWRASEFSIRESVRNALLLAAGKFRSIAFPLIGAGTGGFSPAETEEIMKEEIDKTPFDGDIIIVRFRKS
ncbi:MAG: macro domain-containing protein [Betaproteobacteria bacterium]|nr:macro domain-containing protein [Betaproteobacteria bacterium]